MTTSFQEGDLIAGKYRVSRVLATGGMGIVVAAEHIHLGQMVALKLLLPDVAAQPEAVRRFLREAHATVRIRSEHVVRVMDGGTLPTGAPYIVMELLDGSDLGQLVAEQRTLAISEVVDYVLQAMEAVAEAHALGIVHRDLKPANLFLTHRADGSSLVKVLDFGISKLTAPGAAAGATATNVTIGSPRYMSPEQIRSSKDVDVRTDVWSLGVILYECLAGRYLFPSDTISEILAMVVADPPTPLRAARPDAPAELETIILRCLEKDPARRPQNVAELARLLLPFGSRAARTSVERIVKVVNGPGADTGAVHVSAAPSSFGLTVAPAEGRYASRVPRRAIAVLLGGFAAFVLLFVMVRWLVRPAERVSDLAAAPPLSSRAEPAMAVPSQRPEIAATSAAAMASVPEIGASAFAPKNAARVAPVASAKSKKATPAPEPSAPDPLGERL